MAAHKPTRDVLLPAPAEKECPKLLRYAAWGIFIYLLMNSSGVNILVAHTIDHCGGDVSNWIWILFPFEPYYPQHMRFELDADGKPLLFGMNYLGLDIPAAFIAIVWERVMVFYVVPRRQMPKLMHFPEFRDTLVSVITALLNVLTLGVVSVWWGSYLDRAIWNHWRITDVFSDPRDPLAFWMCFFLFDFIFYWLHRWDHVFSWLWSHHVSHHSSEYYDLSVAVRRNAFDFLTPHYLISSIGLSFLFPPLLTAAMYQLQLICQNWIHTALIPQGPRIIEIVFNTPSAHRVHHAKNEDILGKNYGAIFLLWDYLFGTHEFETGFGEAQGRELHYGIIPPLNSWNPIAVQFHQFKHMLCVQTKWHGILAPLKHWTPPGGKCPKLGTRLNPIKKFGEGEEQSTQLKLFIVMQCLVLAGLVFFASYVSASESNQKWCASLTGMSVFAAHNLLFVISFCVLLAGFVNLSDMMSAVNAVSMRRALISNICFHVLLASLGIAVAVVGHVSVLVGPLIGYVVVHALTIAGLWQVLPRKFAPTLNASQPSLDGH